MKWILSACLICFPVLASAFGIGEIFEDSVYGKPGKNTKIEGGQSEKMPSRRVYTVTFSSKYETTSSLVVVSSTTGKIVSIKSWHDDIYEALYWATYYCEGEVSMPTKMVWSSGMPIENVPGKKYQGKVFSINISRGLGTKFGLDVECYDYMHK
jgi:hypothetical protein